MRFRALLVGCALLFMIAPLRAESTVAETVDEAHRKALARGCAYLWSAQGEDGGWHSPTYGLLKSGQALTPFILHALLQVPREVYPHPQAETERALRFIRDHVNREGALGKSDPDFLEYPNYATAYGVLCLLKAGREPDLILIRRMLTYLARQQYAEESGFEPGSPAYGGWGFGGSHLPGVTGHMDVAHTRRVLQALRAGGWKQPEVFHRSLRFLAFVQKEPSDGRPQPPPIHRMKAPPKTPFDGGFYLSPIILDANKGEILTGPDGLPLAYGSYATATCDGVLALRAAGLAPDHPAVVRAREWLVAHPRLDIPEGIPVDQTLPWSQSLHFYHLAVRAEAGRALALPGEWRTDLASWMIPLQQPDGHWINHDGHLMKEDDPFLCTALAVVALANALPSP